MDNVDPTSVEYAKLLDRQDPLAHLRDEFHIPINETNGEPLIYFLNNSLGLQPKSAQRLVLEELDAWKRQGANAHFKGHHPYDRPWTTIDDQCIKLMSPIIGAHEDEIVITGSLTTNLHMLLSAFYRPTVKRYKILIEEHVFSSDYFAVKSQIRNRFNGNCPKDESILMLKAKEGEFCLDHNDIIDYIEEFGDEIALILLSGIQYYTGQLFRIEEITRKAHEKNCIIGWDLAHAIGNVPLKLNAWNVDFAVWCSYKYLCSGPGSVAGIFLHRTHHESKDLCFLEGWWGNRLESRFEMDLKFDPYKGARRLQLSNSCILSVVCHLSSLQIFAKTTIDEMRAKSWKLCQYFRKLLSKGENTEKMLIITPNSYEESGAQLSLYFRNNCHQVHDYLASKGIIGDLRKPNVIRFSLSAINTFQENPGVFMPPKEGREYVSPLLQPPLNRLFIPCPRPDFLPQTNQKGDGYHGPRIGTVSEYMKFLLKDDPNCEKSTKSTLDKKEKKKALQLAKLQKKMQQYNPNENPNATKDPFKTLFVGRLAYDINERTLQREFERWGPIKNIKMIYSPSGQFLGYAFIEFENENDLRKAYIEADYMKIHNRRIVVDVERGCTVKGWLPRRLGGGLGKTRAGGDDVNQKYSGRESNKPSIGSSSLDHHRHHRDDSNDKNYQSFTHHHHQSSSFGSSSRQQENSSHHHHHHSGDRSQTSKRHY